MTQGEIIKELKSQIETLERRVDGLERWRSWILGLGAGVLAVLGVFANGIKQKLGIT